MLKFSLISGLVLLIVFLIRKKEPIASLPIKVVRNWWDKHWKGG